MPGTSGLTTFFSSRYVRILSAALILQAFGLYAISRRESVPPMRPLSEFPQRIGNWGMAQESTIEKEVLDVLRADDTLIRLYVRQDSREVASLFVAFFKSQRSGQAPHSPKNCLPGSGWVPSTSEILSVPVQGYARPIEVNRYIVAKGDEKSVVLYWYQSRDRTIASEYRAKIYLVADAVRYNRTDTALVRVVVPVVGNDDEAASRTAIRFVQDLYAPLRQQLPS
jgi:EpsI family protein